MSCSDSVNPQPVDSLRVGAVWAKTYVGGKQVDTDLDVLKRGDIAHAIAEADSVRVVRAGEPPRCLLCSRESEPGIFVVVKPATAGTTDLDGNHYVMVCRRCRSAASEDAESAVVELARAGRRAEELLMFVRRRADIALSGWWGGTGALTREELEAASVAFRRAVERLKPFLPGVS